MKRVLQIKNILETRTRKLCWYEQLASAIKFTFYDAAYYRPQRSWGKVIFSQASVILSTGGSTWAGTPPGTRYNPPRTRYTPPGTRYTPWDQVHTPVPPDQTPPPPSSACREIRATSGRYASYWIAFLFITKN